MVSFSAAPEPLSLPVAPPAAAVVQEQLERMPGKVSPTTVAGSALGPALDATRV
jgi:hypothetical protein